MEIQHFKSGNILIEEKSFLSEKNPRNVTTSFCLYVLHFLPIFLSFIFYFSLFLPQFFQSVNSIRNKHLNLLELNILLKMGLTKIIPMIQGLVNANMQKNRLIRNIWGEKSSRKQMTLTMQFMFIHLKFQDNVACIFLDIYQNV